MPEEEIVAAEPARVEVESWLDYKKLSAGIREAKKEQVDALVNYVRDGVLSLNEKKEFVHKLAFPTEGDAPIRELTYKPRVNLSTINEKMKGLKAGAVDERLMAYASAITGKPVGVMQKLDTVDYAVSQAIALFFI